MNILEIWRYPETHKINKHIMNEAITKSNAKTTAFVLDNVVFCKNNRYFCSNVHPKPNRIPHAITTANKYIVVNV